MQQIVFAFATFFSCDMSNNAIIEAGFDVHLLGNSHVSGAEIMISISQQEGKLRKLGSNAIEAVNKIKRKYALDLSRCDVSDAQIAQILANNEFLVEIKLSNTKINGECLTAMAGLSQLRGLSLSGCSFEPQLLHKLKSLKHLEWLSFSETAFDPDALQWIAALPELKRLYLAHTRVDDEFMSLIARNSLLEKLEVLDVSYTAVSDEGMRSLCTGKLTNINRLLCEGTGITDRGIECLLLSFRLNVVNVHKTRVSGSVFLNVNLERLKWLKRIIVDKSPLTDKIAARISPTDVELIVLDPATSRQIPPELEK